jgi:multisubunit Na+/H+ antiporter MnhG subunit
VTARDYVVGVLVVGAIAAELMCCLGLLLMRNAVDRLHYVGGAATLGPAMIAAAVCVREGLVSSQGLNSILIAVLLAFGSASVTGATLRMIRLRQRGTLESTAAERKRA